MIKFLIDEDVPLKLMKFMASKGFDVTRVPTGSTDTQVAALSRKEERVLVTLDKDFTNTAIYPPSEHNIIRIQIHPPYAQEIISAVEKLLASKDYVKYFKGLVILQKKGHIRISG